MWWAITTVTTVGYGDVPIKTDTGRVIGICVMVTGIGLVALLTAAAADRIIRHKVHSEVKPAKADVQDQLDSMTSRLESMSNRLHAMELLLSKLVERETREEAATEDNR